MAAISLQVAGVQRAQAGLRRRAYQLANLRAVNRQAVILLFRWVQDNFAQEGRLAEPGGWQALAPSTVRRRRSFHRGRGLSAGTFAPKILQDTGALRSRWDLLSDARTGELRSKVAYSREHQEGRSGRPPRRRILPTEVQALDMLRPLYREHVRVSIR